MNRSLFETHYRSFFREIYSFVFKQVQHPDEAMELTQEVFLALFKRMAEDNSVEQVRPWLYGVARHKALDRHNAVKRRPDVATDPLEPTLETRQVEREFTRRAVWDWILQHLEQEDFQLLLLHLQGFRNRELCEMFGLTEVVIKKRLQRTREKTLAYFQQKS